MRWRALGLPRRRGPCRGALNAGVGRARSGDYGELCPRWRETTVKPAKARVAGSRRGCESGQCAPASAVADTGRRVVVGIRVSAREQGAGRCAAAVTRGGGYLHLESLRRRVVGVSPHRCRKSPSRFAADPVRIVAPQAASGRPHGHSSSALTWSPQRFSNCRIVGECADTSALPRGRRSAQSQTSSVSQS